MLKTFGGYGGSIVVKSDGTFLLNNMIPELNGANGLGLQIDAYNYYNPDKPIDMSTIWKKEMEEPGNSYSLKERELFGDWISVSRQITIYT